MVDTRASGSAAPGPETDGRIDAMADAAPLGRKSSAAAAGTATVALATGRGAQLLGVAAAIAVGLWLARDTWGPGLVSGLDVTGHLVRTDEGLRILRGWHLDGWSPRFGVGYQEFLFYGPGFTWLIGLVRLLTLGLVSVPGALKVVSVASFVAVAPAATFVARSFGLGRTAAGVAAVLSLAASSPFGVGVDGLFGTGLVPQQVGAVALLVALGAVVRVVDDPGSRRWTAVTTIALTAMVLTHLISVVIFAVFLVFVGGWLVLDGRVTLAAVRRLLWSAATAAAVSAFWWMPLLVNRDLHGPVATWSTPDFGTRMADVFNGRVLFTPLLATAIVLGLAWAWVRVGARRPHAVIVAAVPLLVLAVEHWSSHAWTNEMTLQLANRTLGIAGVLLVLPLAAAIAAPASRLAPRALGAHAVAVAVAAALVVLPERGEPGVATTITPPVPQLADAAAALGRLVPEGGRFVTVRDFPGEIERTRMAQPDRWLAWASGVDTLATFPIEVSNVVAASGVPDSILGQPVEAVTPALVRFGVTHVVTTADEHAARFTDSGDYRVVWHESPVSILEVDDASIASGTTVESSRVRDADGGSYSVDVTTSAAGPVSLAVAWSPKWEAEVDGRAVAVGAAPDELIEVTLPAGRHTVDLRFARDDWEDRAGLAITVVACMLLLAGRRRRQALVTRLRR